MAIKLKIYRRGWVQQLAPIKIAKGKNPPANFVRPENKFLLFLGLDSMHR